MGDKDMHKISKESLIIDEHYFDFDNKTVFNISKELSNLFGNLTDRLNSKYPINKGVLLLRLAKGEPLTVISLWEKGELKDGLLIKLPAKSSLFEQVIAHNQAYIEDFSASFSGNFFEKKLLLNEESKTFVLQPLRFQNNIFGLIGFSSETPLVFTVFEESQTQQLISSFAEIAFSRVGYL